MNADNFHEYLKNPAMLHQVTYHELKSLVMQYPFSPNLRYLLLLKSLFDKNKDFDRNLVLASFASPDRDKLRRLVKQYSRLSELQENYAINDEFLELKDLAALDELDGGLTAEAPSTEAKVHVNAIEPTGAPAEPIDGQGQPRLEDPDDFGFLDDFEHLQPDHFINNEKSESLEPLFFEEQTSNSEAEVGSGFSANILEDLLKEDDPAIDDAVARPSSLAMEILGEDPGMPSGFEVMVEDEFPEPIAVDNPENLDNQPDTETVEDWAAGSADSDGFVALAAIESMPYEMKSVSLYPSEHLGRTDEPHTPEIEESEFALGAEGLANPFHQESLQPANNTIELEITHEQEGLTSSDSVPAPLPKASFHSWQAKLKPYSSLRAKAKGISDHHLQADSERLENNPDPIVEESIAEHEDIVSETLALILEKQGFYGKAIAMYQRLSLQNPEKSSLFAAKIEELNRKI